MKVSGSPPIYCFLMRIFLNLVAQFDKLLPRTLKNSDRLLKTKRKEKRQIRDSETLRSMQNASEISRSGQNFLRPTSVFRGTSLCPYFQDRRGVSSLWFVTEVALYQNFRSFKWGIEAAIRNDFRAGVLKSYTVKCIDIRIQGKSR